MAILFALFALSIRLVRQTRHRRDEQQIATIDNNDNRGKRFSPSKRNEHYPLHTRKQFYWRMQKGQQPNLPMRKVQTFRCTW
jgi:hypothetical protein